MKKNTSKTVALTLRPIDDALLHQVSGGSMGSDMLAGATTGAAAGVEQIQLKQVPIELKQMPVEAPELKPFPR